MRRDAKKPSPHLTLPSESSPREKPAPPDVLSFVDLLSLPPGDRQYAAAKPFRARPVPKQILAEDTFAQLKEKDFYRKIK